MPAASMRPALCWGLILVGLWPAPLAAELRFADRSADLPVSQRYEGDWGHYVGGGVAVLDCDADGLPDFLAAGGEAPTRLYRNQSGVAGDLRFAASPFPDLTRVTGAYPLDVDGDDLLDLIVLRDGPNVLLRGQGACRFETAPTDWGFDGGDAWTTAFSATFEAGQDWPTLAIGNYVDKDDPEGPFEVCEPNHLIRAEGRRFARPSPLEPGFCALSMLFSDWKRSGEVDLRISNDRHYYVRAGREQMWRLNPVTEYTKEDGWPQLRLWGMGIASRDLTGDGLPEVVLTSMGDQLIQINEGKGVMRNAPYEIGTYATTPYKGDDGRPSTGWHPQFGDVNNDGRDDLFIAKGNVEQMPTNAMRDPNNLLIQQPDGRFVEQGDQAGIGTVERSRGAALVDLNRDGRLDLLVINRRAPMEIWQNVTPDTGQWLSVDLRQPGPNRRAIGAFIELRLPDGRVQTRELTVGGGHVSGSALPEHFGLGATTRAEIRVTWPGGPVSDWTPLATGRHWQVSPGPGTSLTLAEEP